MNDIRFINNYVNESKKLISFNKSDKKKISEVVNILKQIKLKKKTK